MQCVRSHGDLAPRPGPVCGRYELPYARLRCTFVCFFVLTELASTSAEVGTAAGVEPAGAAAAAATAPAPAPAAAAAPAAASQGSGCFSSGGVVGAAAVATGSPAPTTAAGAFPVPPAERRSAAARHSCTPESLECDTAASAVGREVGACAVATATAAVAAAAAGGIVGGFCGFCSSTST